jgi:hypothetical protein
MKRELTDVPISGACNVIKKAAEKIRKHEDLTTELQRMWSVTTKAIPEITKGNCNRLKMVNNQESTTEQHCSTATLKLCKSAALQHCSTATLQHCNTAVLQL